MARKKKSKQAPFIALPKHIINSQQFTSLNPYVLKLLIDLFAQFRGHNNGDFSAAWKLMAKKGWKSRATLYKTLKTLLNAGFIEKTRQGGRHLCCLYAVTWLPIDECDGKLDVMPTRLASNLWKKELTRSKDIINTPDVSTTQNLQQIDTPNVLVPPYFLTFLTQLPCSFLDLAIYSALISNHPKGAAYG